MPAVAAPLFRGRPLQVCREAAEVDVQDSIMERLAPLASSTAQRRWMANGTPDEYLIPEQLLEDALDATRFAGLPHVRSGLPPRKSRLNGAAPSLSMVNVPACLWTVVRPRSLMERRRKRRSWVPVFARRSSATALLRLRCFGAGKLGRHGFMTLPGIALAL